MNKLLENLGRFAPYLIEKHGYVSIGVSDYSNLWSYQCFSKDLGKNK